MTAQQPPVALQNVSTLNADDFRGLIQALIPTEGIIAAGDLAVAQNGTPNMSVNVAAGSAVIAGDDTPATQGSYFVKNDATVNLAIAASDPTNPRKDIVIAQVRDSFYSVPGDDWRLTVVTGTPAASPAEPALPVDSIKLAVVAVAAAATSITNANITDSRPLAAALGGFANAAWTSYTPTLTQGATVAKTVTYAKWQRTGRMITVEGILSVTGSGTSSTGVEIGLPVAAALGGGSNGVIGTGMIYNVSTSFLFKGIADLLTTSTFCLRTVHSTSAAALGAASFTGGLASGDQVRFSVTYEAAT